MTVGVVYSPSDVYPSEFRTATDDDRPSAAVFALCTNEPTANAVTYLKNRGAYVASAESHGTCSLTIGDVSGVTGNDGAWTDFSTGAGVTPYVDITGCAVGDKIEVFFRGGMSQVDSLNAGVRLASTQNGGATVAIPGADTIVFDYATFAIPDRVVLSGIVTIATAGTCRVKLQGFNTDPAGKVGVLGTHTYYLRAVRHRRTAA